MIRSQKVFRVLWTVFAVLFCTVVSAQEQSEVPKPVDDVKFVNITGKVIAPNEESLDGVSVRYAGLTDQGQCSSSGSACERDGTFSIRVFSNIDAFFTVYDSKNRLTAPIYKVRISTEPPKEEIVIRLEKGIPFEATFLDKNTGEPIPGLHIKICQRPAFTADSNRTALIEFAPHEWETDKNGTVRCRVMPGEYGVGIDTNAFNDEELERGVFAQNITVSETTDAKIEFRIPTPFVGKALYSNGAPAAFCSVSIIPSRSHFRGSSTFTRTDKKGVFRISETPENTTILIANPPSGEQYFAWLKDELASAKEHTFTLLKPSIVKGRILDAKTNEPLANQLFFYWKIDPANPTEKSYMPDNNKTDKDGCFTIKLNPVLQYEMFIVPGRNEPYGGGPYSPRIELAMLKPEELIRKVNLGDLKVDMTKIKIVDDEKIKVKDTDDPMIDKMITITGKLIAPNGESLQGVILKCTGLSDQGRNAGVAICETNGTFSVRVFPNIDAFIFVLDPKNRFTAPTYKVRIAAEPPKEEIVIRLEEGIPLKATFLDEKTGEPIPGLMISLCQYSNFLEQSNLTAYLNLSNQWQTDERGTVQCRVMPGQYHIGADNSLHKKALIEEGIYARKIIVGKTEDVSLEFRIPSPYAGKVLKSDGSPAADAIVDILASLKSIEGKTTTNPSFHTKTDKNGIFRVCKAPENTTISISFLRNTEQYFAWVKEAEKRNDDSVTIFNLLKSSVVKGRLLDVKTNKPIANHWFFCWKIDPANPVMKSSIPDFVRTDSKGRFITKLNPVFRYEILVPVQNTTAGWNDPCVQLTTFEPKTNSDLGDLSVDFDKIENDSKASMSQRQKLFNEQAQKVWRGEKKSVLKIYATKDAEASIQYIEKHQNEEPISSFGICITKIDELSAEEQTEWTEDLRPLSLASDPIMIDIGDIATLPKLRGEEESPWNVPAGDPSTNGDWKKTPGMVNPKILNNFLNDHLKKLEEWKKEWKQ